MFSSVEESFYVALIGSGILNMLCHCHVSMSLKADDTLLFTVETVAVEWSGI